MITLASYVETTMREVENYDIINREETCLEVNLYSQVFVLESDLLHNGVEYEPIAFA